MKRFSTKQPYPENKEYFEQLITQYIPNYKTGKGYEINVTLKQD